MMSYGYHRRKSGQLLLLVLLLWGQFCRAQTYVSGGIYADETWTLANSPYVVTDTITVFPGVTLDIEPGVTVQVGDSMLIEVRGRMNAIGSVGDTIRFTSSSSSPFKGIWAGVYINTFVGGSAYVEYCKMNYAESALRVECCWNGGPVEVRHSSFVDDMIALGGYAGWAELVDSCYFANNQYAITQGDKIITNSKFVNNEYGLFYTERVDVLNSNFCGNRTALYGGRGLIRNNVIMKNGVGIKSVFEGFYDVSDNFIVRNDTGVVFSPFETSEGLGDNNVICQNEQYNVVNLTFLNIPVMDNCWCSSDPVVIAQSIFDGYDDINFGLLDFDPFLGCTVVVIPEPICPGVVDGTPELTVDKDRPMWIYPNPATGSAAIHFQEVQTNTRLSVFDMLGSEVWHDRVTGVQVLIDTEEWGPGVYRVRSVDSEQHVMVGTVLVQ
jgi:Secretion system C-terminal sorting domain